VWTRHTVAPTVGDGTVGKGGNGSAQTLTGVNSHELGLPPADPQARELVLLPMELWLGNRVINTTLWAKARLFKEAPIPKPPGTFVFSETASGGYAVVRSLPLVNACFVAGIPLLTPDGAKPIEQFVPGDLVLSRAQHDVEGVVTPKVVEEVFVHLGKVVQVHIGEQIIGTTAEHPFWVHGKGWLPARELVVGDRLVGHDGQTSVVAKVVDTDRWAIVYNLRVADSHTYFVGCDEWGFSVWAHNICYEEWLTKYNLKHTDELKRIFDSAAARNLTPETKQALRLEWNRQGKLTDMKSWKDLEQVALDNMPAGRALTEKDLPRLKEYLSLPEGANGGRLGKIEVRRLNHRVASDYENEGWKVIGGAGRAEKEYLVGSKGAAYADITLTKDGKTIRIQTATMQNGRLDPLEVLKAEKIRAANPSDELIIISKDTGLPVKYP
jgi:hypothetical protein